MRKLQALTQLCPDRLALVQGDALVVCYLADAASRLQIHSLATGKQEQQVPLPGIGTVTQFAGRREDSEFFFAFSSYTEPGAIYRYAIHGQQGRLCVSNGCMHCAFHQNNQPESLHTFAATSIMGCFHHTYPSLCTRRKAACCITIAACGIALVSTRHSLLSCSIVS